MPSSLVLLPCIPPLLSCVPGVTRGLAPVALRSHPSWGVLPSVSVCEFPKTEPRDHKKYSFILQTSYICPRLLRQDRDKPSTRRDTSILLLLPAGGAEVVRMNGCVNDIDGCTNTSSCNPDTWARISCCAAKVGSGLQW
ncbi:unnamed protein product [Somion occarium]|uniref:Uncharacterized protein n=1 Tax=Somion occarium TaxID=3059160 RepID=A0ABP1CZU5_9APHY